MRIRNLFGIAILCGVLGAVGCSSNAGGGTAGSSTSGSTATGGGQTVSLTGAGSTFVQPAMDKWVYAYDQANPGISINYQGVGSGAGISQVKSKTVDFGASDVALSDKELAEMPGPITQFPVVEGGVVMAYNLPSVSQPLKLSGDVIADIYLGKVKTWNDPEIAQQNPGVSLPTTAITVVYRADASGTSYIFTNYLSTVSPAWNSGPGKGKTVAWPVGVGEPKNPGVATMVKKTEGAIGYVELAYALTTKMSYAQVRNKSGKYVECTIESTAAAANAALDALKKDIRTPIVDTSAPDGYPIAGFTYVLLPTTPTDKTKAKALVDFLKWALGPGQDTAKDLDYAPLPKSITDVDEDLLSKVQTQ